jgi:hypothetical protein
MDVAYTGWTAETECAVINIEVLKAVNSPQGDIDWAQHFRQI